MEEKYFNFPIQLLEGFMIDTKKVLNNITDYSLYEHSLKLEHGTALEKFKSSLGFYGIKLGNESSSFKSGKLLYSSIPKNAPKVGLNVSIFWKFYNTDKPRFDKVCLLAFLSIKSMLGTKPYFKANNNYLWSRMDGLTSSISNVNELSTEVRRYANEYQTKKIKTELILNWSLTTYSRHTRGFYVSYKLTLKELIKQAEKSRKSTKEKDYKQMQKELVKEVLLELEGKRP
jgi:hypothetical protein